MERIGVHGVQNKRTSLVLQAAKSRTLIAPGRMDDADFRTSVSRRGFVWCQAGLLLMAEYLLEHRA
eukprot:m.109138 g.109138  ORF g.109138 m.109138 type:complete len:66 (+) comp16958_c0_seq9:796-993(+)